MDIVLYMGFSILEVCAMFYMIFRIFKIDIMVKEFIFASTIMAFISYVLRAEYQLPYVDVMIQASLMLSFMWMLFRIHIFYATILTGMAYSSSRISTESPSWFNTLISSYAPFPFNYFRSSFGGYGL